MKLKMFVFLFTGLFLTTASISHATDIGNFDIAGVKLGMTLDTVKKVTAKSFPHITHSIKQQDVVEDLLWQANNGPTDTLCIFFCKKELGGGAIKIIYSHSFIPALESKGEIEPIIRQILQKYGEPREGKPLKGAREFNAAWGCGGVLFGGNPPKDSGNVGLEVQLSSTELKIELFDRAPRMRAKQLEQSSNRKNIRF